MYEKTRSYLKNKSIYNNQLKKKTFIELNSLLISLKRFVFIYFFNMYQLNKYLD